MIIKKLGCIDIFFWNPTGKHVFDILQYFEFFTAVSLKLDKNNPNPLKKAFTSYVAKLANCITLICRFLPPCPSSQSL